MTENATSKDNSAETSPAPRRKLRFGRLILVIVILAALFILARWVIGNAHRVEEIERKMQDLSSKLDEQNKNAQVLNNSLRNFSSELSKVSNMLYDLRESMQTQGQISSHDLNLIKNDLKNIKGKIDGIRLQSGTYRDYYQ